MFFFYYIRLEKKSSSKNWKTPKYQRLSKNWITEEFELRYIFTSKLSFVRNRCRTVCPLPVPRRLEWNRAWSASVWTFWRTARALRGLLSLLAKVPTSPAASPPVVCRAAEVTSAASNFARLNRRCPEEPAASAEPVTAPTLVAPDNFNHVLQIMLKQNIQINCLKSTTITRRHF